MSLRTSATRYAKALLDVAIQESDPGRIEMDLTALLEVMTGHADARRAMLSPAIPQQVRLNVVRALTDHLDVQPPTAKLLAMLATRGRLELLPDLVDVYRQRLLTHRNIVRAQVSAARPLSTEKVQALERSLGALTGKQMQLDVAVDPSLIGGVVAMIGSTVYDGSIRTQLQRMRKQLVDNA
jgi:F-type H+-transporting ATPase subunit delta